MFRNYGFCAYYSGIVMPEQLRCNSVYCLYMRSVREAMNDLSRVGMLISVRVSFVLAAVGLYVIMDIQLFGNLLSLGLLMNYSVLIFKSTPVVSCRNSKRMFLKHFFRDMQLYCQLAIKKSLLFFIGQHQRHLGIFCIMVQCNQYNER